MHVIDIAAHCQHSKVPKWWGLCVSWSISQGYSSKDFFVQRWSKYCHKADEAWLWRNYLTKENGDRGVFEAFDFFDLLFWLKILWFEFQNWTRPLYFKTWSIFDIFSKCNSRKFLMKFEMFWCFELKIFVFYPHYMHDCSKSGKPGKFRE